MNLKKYTIEKCYSVRNLRFLSIISFDKQWKGLSEEKDGNNRTGIIYIELIACIPFLIVSHLSADNAPSISIPDYIYKVWRANLLFLHLLLSSFRLTKDRVLVDPWWKNRSPLIEVDVYTEIVAITHMVTSHLCLFVF